MRIHSFKKVVFQYSQSHYFSSGFSAPNSFGKSPNRPISPKTMAASNTNTTATEAITGVYPYLKELNNLMGRVSTVKPATM